MCTAPALRRCSWPLASMVMREPGRNLIRELQTQMPHRWFSQSGSGRAISYTSLILGRRLRISMLRHGLGVPVVLVLRQHHPDRTGHSVRQGDRLHRSWFSREEAFTPRTLIGTEMAGCCDDRFGNRVSNGYGCRTSVPAVGLPRHRDQHRPTDDLALFEIVQDGFRLMEREAGRRDRL